MDTPDNPDATDSLAALRDSLTVQALAPSDTEPAGKLKSGQHLSFFQKAAILEARRRQPHLTLRQIAEVVGTTRQSVAATLASAQADAIAVMKSETLEALADWRTARAVAAEKGYHQPAKDWLLHAGAIDPLETDNGVRVGVQVIVPALPGTPGYAPSADLAPFASPGGGPEHD